MATAIESLSYEGQWVVVLDGDLVEGTVVDAEAQCAILLFDEEDGLLRLVAAGCEIPAGSTRDEGRGEGGFG